MSQSDLYWKDRVAIITGATHGIGLRLAERLAERGTQIATIYKSDDKQAHLFVEKMKSMKTDAVVVKGDVSDKKFLTSLAEETVAKWGRIDFLVNSVATDIWAPIFDLSEEEWIFSQEIILNAPFRLIKYCLPVMRRQRFGRIINIGASSKNYMQGQANLAPFGINKAALTVLTKTLAVEEIANGITVNMVAPGSTADAGSKSEEERIPIESIPLGRRVTRDEVTEAILYFLSSNARGTTGQCIGVNGGCST